MSSSDPPSRAGAAERRQGDPGGGGQADSAARRHRHADGVRPTLAIITAYLHALCSNAFSPLSDAPNLTGFLIQLLQSTQGSEAAEASRLLDRRTGEAERRLIELERRTAAAEATAADTAGALRELDARQAQLGEHQALSAEVVLQLREQAAATGAAVTAASAAAGANAQELAEFRAAVREVMEALRGQVTSVRRGAVDDSCLLLVGRFCWPIPTAVTKPFL